MLPLCDRDDTVRTTAPGNRRGRTSALLGLAVALVVANNDALWAVCASTETCLHEIEQAQQDTRTITAHFVQVKHLSLLDEPLTSTGRFVFKRPDRVLLEIEQPQPARVVIKGQDVQIPNLSERDRQALAMAPMGAMFTQLSAIFTGAPQALRSNFDVDAREDEGTIHITLVPRREARQRMFRQIDLRFARPELLAREIRLEDAFGDHLEITLRDAQRNTEVPDSTFDLTER